ncbi:RNA12 protein-domain-containing protein [Polychytrium aggregatum]|uniref:RNA12 protein-domain-containing protein n=1 Tax=Polychytrium aggregatum TaxID=110093 RepID=UPI0022FDF5D3|nr:RNA12 protein-domain-containing protein [Polychytrium aggregatum]KAI9204123.1 RNA12 protein-domain-containing protein [Polychytrium aggregatum]
MASKASALARMVWGRPLLHAPRPPAFPRAVPPAFPQPRLLLRALATSAAEPLAPEPAAETTTKREELKVLDIETLAHSSVPPTVPESPDAPTTVSGRVWFENVFPIKVSIWDPRYFFVQQYANDLRLRAKAQLLPPLDQFPHEFIYKKTIPNVKEGGLYLLFDYKGQGAKVEDAYEVIKAHASKVGYRTWYNWTPVKSFRVKGEPFMEDMVGHLPTSTLKVEFLGNNLTAETLYREFRPYGKINSIELQPSTDKELPRYALVNFARTRSATSARNCIHGEVIDGTRLQINYETPRSRRAFWSWLTGNYRVSIPVILASVIALSYLIFDPIRIFCITNKLTNRFNIQGYLIEVAEWWKVTGSALLSKLTFLGFVMKSKLAASESAESWKERQAEEKRLKSFLKEEPDNFILLTGPRGSGKSELALKVVKDAKHKIVIKCEDFMGKPEHVLLNELASQMGYFPVFGFMSTISSLIDTVMTAGFGSKTGISGTSIESQVRNIFDTATMAITALTHRQLHLHSQSMEQEQKRRDSLLLAEESKKNETGEKPVDVREPESRPDGVYKAPHHEMEYPVIVIDGFLHKDQAKQHYVSELIIEWATFLIEYRLAHVIFVTNNVEVQKKLTKALPQRSLDVVRLVDASSESAMAFVKKRLGLIFTPTDLQTCVESLGGRLKDLELFIQKIHAGATPTAAFNDIVMKSVAEVRRIGTGEEDENRSLLPWTPVQFWKIVQVLSKVEEAPFDDLRFHPLFKGDDRALRGMERAGLISIGLQNGRPFVLKPGKPVYRNAFSHLLNDTKFAATMGILTHKALQADEEAKINKYLAEMNTITNIITGGGANPDGRGLVSREAKGDLTKRLEFLATLVAESQAKIAEWYLEEQRCKKVVKLKEQ